MKFNNIFHRNGPNDTELKNVQSAVDKIEQLASMERKLASPQERASTDFDALVQQAWQRGSSEALKVSIESLDDSSIQSQPQTASPVSASISLKESENFINFWRHQEQEQERLGQEQEPTSAISDLDSDEVEKKIQEAWNRGARSGAKLPAITNSTHTFVAEATTNANAARVFPKDANVKVMRKNNVKKRRPIPVEFTNARI